MASRRALRCRTVDTRNLDAGRGTPIRVHPVDLDLTHSVLQQPRLLSAGIDWEVKHVLVWVGK